MSARFRRDESVLDGTRRLITKDVEAARQCLAAKDPHQAAHGARKCLKRIRALLRLVREPLGNRRFSRENAHYRDAGRALSVLRDGQAVIGAVDALSDRYASSLKGQPFARVKKSLQARRDASVDRASFEALSERLAAHAAELESWRFSHGGFSALRPGLKETYQRGRRAFEHALSEPSAETLHEWRKQVKYLRHQVAFLEDLWPEMMATHRHELKTLSDLLGDDHDLAVLAGLLPELDGVGDEDRALLRSLIDRRRLELQTDLPALGRKLYGEKPKRFLARVEDYWRCWRKPDPGGLQTAAAM